MHLNAPTEMELFVHDDYTVVADVQLRDQYTGRGEIRGGYVNCEDVYDGIRGEIVAIKEYRSMDGQPVKFTPEIIADLEGRAHRWVEERNAEGGF